MAIYTTKPGMSINDVKKANAAAKSVSQATSTVKTPTTNATPVTPSKQVTYKDPSGTNQTGFIINDKTYKDAAGTQRIDNGSVVPSANGKQYKMIDGQGYEVYQPNPSELSSLKNALGLNKNSSQEREKVTSTPKTKSAIDYLAEKVNSQIAQAPAKYDPLRTQAYTEAKIGLRGENEVLASQGLAGKLNDVARSGESETGRINREVGLGNSLNKIDTDQQNYINELGNQLLQAQFEAAQKKEEQDRQDQIATIGAFSNDYQEKVNELSNDGDSSNDWLINYIKSARNDKINKQHDDYSKTVGQYYDNYQAEIDRINAKIKEGDNSEAWKLPSLQEGRSNKVIALAENNLKNQPTNTDLYNRYFDLFKSIGYVNSPEMAKILGIPENTKTTEYLSDEYSRSKPYYKPTTSKVNAPKPVTTSERAKLILSRVDDYKSQGYSPDEALQYATEDVDGLITVTDATPQPQAQPINTGNVISAMLPFGLGGLLNKNTNTTTRPAPKKPSIEDRINNVVGG